jgi:hypothetical protein
MRTPPRRLGTLSEHLDASAGEDGCSHRENRQVIRRASGDRPRAPTDAGPTPGCWAVSSSPPWPWCWWASSTSWRGFRAVPEGDHLVDPGLLFPFDLTAWGVVHLVIGVLLIAAGFTVRTARLWAGSVGIAFAMISAIANFLFVAYSPDWSLTVIALDVVVIWALCTYR